MTQKPSKLSKNNKKIPLKIAIQAKSEFIQGASLSDIVRKYSAYSRDQFKTLRDNEKWVEEKLIYKSSLESELEEELNESKFKLKQGLVKIVDEAISDIEKGSLKICSVRDLEKVINIIDSLTNKEKQLFDYQMKPHEFSALLDYACERYNVPLPKSYSKAKAS